MEPVAEVVWFDPSTRISPEKPGKIIDASLAFMDDAPIGTKLYAAPVVSDETGMTLRDWFAGQALMAALDTRDTEIVARRCYEMADAMLSERNRAPA